MPKSERLRRLERPFGWVPCRLLTEGHLADMGAEATQLYLLLVLAANRDGVSFYGPDKIKNTLRWTATQLRQARNHLVKQDLLAYDGHNYQLLSLQAPTRPSASATQRPDVAAATDQQHPTHASRLQASPEPTQDDHTHGRTIPEEAKVILRRAFGPNYI